MSCVVRLALIIVSQWHNIIDITVEHQQEVIPCDPDFSYYFCVFTSVVVWCVAW